MVHGHRPRPRVSEEVDQHILGVELEYVVVRRADRRRSLRVGGLADRLDCLDAKRLDDGSELHGRLDVRGKPPVTFRATARLAMHDRCASGKRLT